MVDLVPNVVDVQASAVDHSDWPPAATINGNPNDGWAKDGDGVGSWLRYQFSPAVTLRQYTVTPEWGRGTMPVGWTLDASADATTWTTLDTQSALVWPTVGQSQTFTLATPAPYPYYRFTYSGNSGGAYLIIMENGFAGSIPIPPVDAPLDVDVTVPTGPILLDVPPQDADASVAVTVVRGLDAPPLDLTAEAPVTQTWRIYRALLDPQITTGGVTGLPVTRPSFTLDIRAREGALGTVTVEAQWEPTGDWSFPAPIVKTLDVDLVGNRFSLDIESDADFDIGPVYLFRARVILNAIPGAWTDTLAFTIVDGTWGQAEVALAWTVTTDPPGPDLWFIDPAASQAGAQVTVVGHGFPDTGTVSLAGVDAPVQSWTRVAATANAGTDARTIDPANMIIDCEHDEVVVSVPDVPPPGGQLVVTGS